MSINKTKYKTYFHTVGAGTAMIGITYGLARYSYGLFLPYIENSFNLDLKMLGILGSSSYIGYLISTGFGSVISGKYGPKYPLLMGGLSAVIGMLLVSVASNYWLLLTGITIAGMSPGLAYPPLSDIVVISIKQNRRDTAFAIINAGTSLGVIIATPLSLLAGSNWRYAWLAFACISIFVTFWNFLMAPSVTISEKNKKQNKIEIGWFLNKRSFKLFIWTFLFGIVTSVFWTYSVKFIETLNSSLSIYNLTLSSETFTKIFWFGVGISGILGVLAGKFINLFGLTAMLKSCFAFAVLSTLILPLYPANFLLLMLSSFLFGIAFMFGSAYVGIWSINVFHDRPSLGMGSAFLLLSLGQMLGPSIFGYIAQDYSLNIIFYIGAILGSIAFFIKPTENIYTMNP